MLGHDPTHVDVWDRGFALLVSRIGLTAPVAAPRTAIPRNGRRAGGSAVIRCVLSVRCQRTTCTGSPRLWQRIYRTSRMRSQARRAASSATEESRLWERRMFLFNWYASPFAPVSKHRHLVELGPGEFAPA